MGISSELRPFHPPSSSSHTYTQHTQSQTHTKTHTYTQRHTNAHAHANVNVSVSLSVSVSVFEVLETAAHDSMSRRNPLLLLSFSLLSSLFTLLSSLFSLLFSSLIPSYPLFHTKKNKFFRPTYHGYFRNSGVFREVPPVANHFLPHVVISEAGGHSKKHLPTPGFDHVVAKKRQEARISTLTIPTAVDIAEGKRFSFFASVHQHA